LQVFEKRKTFFITMYYAKDSRYEICPNIKSNNKIKNIVFKMRMKYIVKNKSSNVTTKTSFFAKNKQYTKINEKHGLFLFSVKSKNC